MATRHSSRPELTTTDPPLPPPRQARSIEKRATILSVSRDLFDRHGYNDVSIERIAAESGIAVGAFYTYFRSKRQLLAVLMTSVIDRFAETDMRPMTRGPLLAALRTYIPQMFQGDVELFQIVKVWRQAATADREIAALDETVVAWTETRVLRLFQRLGRQGTGRSSRDTSAFAAIINRHMWGLLARASAMTQQELNREMRVTADIVYRYLFRDPD